MVNPIIFNQKSREFYCIEVGNGRANEVLKDGELPGLQQTIEIILVKRCEFSSLNGVGSRLAMLNVIGRDFSSRKMHVSLSVIVLSEVFE